MNPIWKSIKRIYKQIPECIRDIKKGDWEHFSFNLNRLVDWSCDFLKHGFHEADLWSLDLHLAGFIAPRVRAFLTWFDGRSVPTELTQEEWKVILDKIATAFELISKDDLYGFDEKTQGKITEGLDLFRKYYFHLWD